MHFYELMKELSKDKNNDLYVDMDGVIASFDFGHPLDFKIKRPLYTNIKVLEEVSKLDNIKLHILSVCRKDYQIQEKHDWLDKYAPFFLKENRHIISKESLPDISSAECKLRFLKQYKTSMKRVLIDDDNTVLKLISDNIKDILLLQDSELID